MLNVNELLIYKMHSQHKIPLGDYHHAPHKQDFDHGICGPWSNDLVILGSIIWEFWQIAYRLVLRKAEV